MKAYTEGDPSFFESKALDRDGVTPKKPLRFEPPTRLVYRITVKEIAQLAGEIGWAVTEEKYHNFRSMVVEVNPKNAGVYTLGSYSLALHTLASFDIIPSGTYMVEPY